MPKFSVKKRIESFKYAFNGIRILFQQEHNVWIHTTITVAVIIAGLLFDIPNEEWLFVIFAIGLVFIAEGFNTAIEHLANAVSESYHEKLKNAKDVAAGAVLLAAITSVIIGLVIFIPHLVDELRNWV